MLHPRDGYGRDEEWVGYHPAYREMESIAFGKFGMHAMCNRGGVLGWPTPMPPIAKYVFTICLRKPSSACFAPSTSPIALGIGAPFRNG